MPKKAIQGVITFTPKGKAKKDSAISVKIGEKWRKFAGLRVKSMGGDDYLIVPKGLKCRTEKNGGGGGGGKEDGGGKDEKRGGRRTTGGGSRQRRGGTRGGGKGGRRPT